MATAKRDLRRGEVLDGEGGYCVWGKQVPVAVSLRDGLLPLGLAQHVALVRDIEAGACFGWNKVRIDMEDPVVRIRRDMEVAFGGERRSC